MSPQNGNLKRFFLKNRTVLFFTGLAALLLLPALDNHYFWDDEADTAIFARNILRTGLPSGWDGVNLYGYRNGLLLNADLINRASPWLQYYLTALAFRILGETTFAGRLPFVLLGILAVPLFCRLVFKFTGRRDIALFSLLFLVLSPAFLLFCRQCRYYTLVIVSGLLLLLFYSGLSLRDRKGLFLFSLSCALFFYSNYLLFFTFFGALILAHVLCEFKPDKFKALILAGVITLLFAAPFLFYARPWEAAVMPLFSRERLENARHLFGWYLRDFNFSCFFPLLYACLLPFALLAKDGDESEQQRMGVKKKGLFITVFILITTLFVSYLSDQDCRITSVADIRYVVNLLPLCCLLMGMIAVRLVRWSRLVGGLIIFLTLGTDVFTLMPLYQSGKIKSYLYDYFYELTHDYLTPYETVSEILETDAREGDLILVRPEYCTYPLLFYSGQKFRFCGILSEENEDILRYQKDNLPAYVYSSSVIPDWVVRFSLSPFKSKIRDYILEQGIEYDLQVIERYYYDATRPELFFHNFRPQEGYSFPECIFIGRRVRDAEKEPGAEAVLEAEGEKDDTTPVLMMEKKGLDK